MENVLYNISQVLGITIVHSLWQGLLVYFLLRVSLLVFNPWLTAARKYLLAVAALSAITAWFAVTLFHEVQAYNWLAKPSALTGLAVLLDLPANMRQVNEAALRYYYSIEAYMPYVTAVYALGLVLNMAKVILAYRGLKFIKRTMSLGVQLQQQISRFAKKLDITKKVRVGFSQLVDVPCITGYIKPVILLPVTLSTYLEAEEIEAILMHELAHIKRNDYLINLLQQVITTLLFFNPCVLLINRIISEERENACDDLVVDNTQTPIIYAKALFKLEQQRHNELQLAPAVTGKKYHLLNRIERIMKTKKTLPSVRPALVAMLILTLSICSFALLKPEIAQGKVSVKALIPTIKKMLVAADTVPAKKAAKATSKSTKTVTKSGKKVIKAKTEKDYAFNYNFNYNNNVDGFKDPELERLSKEVEKHGEAIGKYYESPEFKATSAEMDKLGKQISAFYESESVKRGTAEQEKAAAEYDKLWAGKGEQMDKLGKQMDALGKQMESYYNSKEFKDMNAALAKKYGVKENSYYDNSDDNYRKYQAELKTKIPADVQQLNGQMRDLSKQMRDITNNPELKAQQEQMRTAGQNMRTAFNNPNIKAQQEQMRKLGEQMRAFTHSDQIRKEQEQMKQATAKMRAYMNTPEFKKKLKEYKATHPSNYYWNGDNQDNIEKTDKAVKEAVKNEIEEAREKAEQAKDTL
ncbi:M56 family metallopeptidase [Mucilaginibacter litoreus]|uniref:M56 family metallopeptidase n=1 Tax=Mucilaginibacter litoreus TaxID=1048221 RepID=A0ABW3AR98_9SPHI